jgi:hypothetical protein
VNAIVSNLETIEPLLLGPDKLNRHWGLFGQALGFAAPIGVHASAVVGLNISHAHCRCPVESGWG